MIPRCLILLLLAFAGPAMAESPSFDAAPLQQAAQSGDSNAEFQLGTLDYVGLGVVQDYAAAIALLRQSANAGNMEAACEAGFLYQTGSIGQGPPPPDPKQAARWYGKAAAAGNACGEFGLAALEQAGIGTAANPADAARLFAAAAAQGFAQDPTSFPLEQLQQHFYAAAYKVTGLDHWVDLVSVPAGGGQ